MKCVSCSQNIPAAWVHAIQTNVCPSCGEAIQTDDGVELMAGIAAALEKMPNNPQGIAGWLLENYRLEKVGDGEPTGFYGKKNKIARNADDEETPELKIRKPHEVFKQNAGIKTGKTKEQILRELANQINGSEDEDVPEVAEEPTDPEERLIVKQMMSYQGATKEIADDDAVRKMEKLLGGTSDDEDMLPTNLTPGQLAIERDRLERLRKQKELGSGATLGQNKFFGGIKRA